MSRTLRLALLALVTTLVLVTPTLAQNELFGSTSINALEIGLLDDAVVIEDPCGDPSDQTTICVGDILCLREPDHPDGLDAPFLVPPGIDGCPKHYKEHQVPTVASACTAAHIMTPAPPACSPDCCKSRGVTVSTQRTVSCCTKIKTRVCTKDTDTAGTEGH